MYRIHWKTDKGVSGNGEPIPLDIAKAWIDRMESRGRNFRDGIFLPFRFGKNIDNSIKHWLVKV